MATRCVIKVEGINQVKVYKHWDGYPAATLDWLKDFNSDFVKVRGEEDNYYKFAQLLRSSQRDAEKYSLDPSIHTGWGVVPYDFDVWEEYEYTLLSNGEVKTMQLI